MKRPIRLAIVGTGSIAEVHANILKTMPACQLVAAVDITPSQAEAFAGQHGIPAAFGSMPEMLRQVPCDALLISTPDASHAALSIAALRAGKHVLCEKPLALCHADARRMVAAARKADKVAMVNLSYRNWSALQGVAKLVHKGGIGEVRHVEASYLQAWLPSKIWGNWRTEPRWLWRLSSGHGSKGVLGDVGVHIVDFATYPAGPLRSVYAQLRAFPKAPGNRIGEYVLDANDSAVLNVEFRNGALGTIHTTRWCGGHTNRLFLKIAGTHGTVEIDSERSTTAYRICAGRDLDHSQWRDVEVPPTPDNFARFFRAIRTGKPEQPDFARGAEVQQVLDACIRSDAEHRPVTLPVARS